MRVPPRRGVEGGHSSLVVPITADQGGVAVQAFRMVIQAIDRSVGSKDLEIRGESRVVDVDEFDWDHSCGCARGGMSPRWDEPMQYQLAATNAQATC
jgi:hypothetical protein